MTHPLQHHARTILEPKIRATGIAETERQVGLHDSALRAWLGGHRTLTLENLELLADHFGYDVELRLRRRETGRLALGTKRDSEVIHNSS